MIYNNSDRAKLSNPVKRYIKYLEKDLGRTCRMMWDFTNQYGESYLYANFCKNYDKVIITIAYLDNVIGWTPMQIGK